jgi:hypothetical protein
MTYLKACSICYQIYGYLDYWIDGQGKFLDIRCDCVRIIAEVKLIKAP